MTLLDQTETSTPLQALLDGRLLDLPDHLLDILPVGLYVCDGAGLIVRYNRAAANLWGARPRSVTRQFVTAAPIAFTIWTACMCRTPNVPWPMSSRPVRDCAIRRS
jgi:PAS domain